MKSFVLYCKSYRTDVRRVVRLAKSVAQYNLDSIPFYISVPEQDIEIFRVHLQGFQIELLTDESILKKSPRLNLTLVTSMRGSVAQQVVKSEFWRLELTKAFVCLDSDAVFIRPFTENDFLAPDGYTYTVLDEAHDLLESAIQHGHFRVVDAFIREADLVQRQFDRRGRRYSFGPFPLVWHRDVWESLDTNYLQPRSMCLATAILEAPIESRWYGEALLAYRAIPLHPCQALFKVYHYAWQLDEEKRQGVTLDQLSKLYCGVIYQSAWEREMDWPAEGGNLFSRVGRRLRRNLGRI